MTQAHIVLMFLAGFVGIMLWIIGLIALDFIHDDHHNREKRKDIAAPGQHDGYETHDAHHVGQRL